MKKTAGIRALATDIKNNAGTITGKLLYIADLIDANDARTSPDVTKFSVSKTVAIMLLAFAILPSGAAIMCAEYGDCYCGEIKDDFDYDEDEHFCFGEVTTDDIHSLATDDVYQTFQVWL